MKEKDYENNPMLKVECTFWTLFSFLFFSCSYSSFFISALLCSHSFQSGGLSLGLVVLNSSLDGILCQHTAMQFNRR